VNTPNSKNSPLYTAASRGHFEVVEELLNRGADPTWVDMNGRSLIWHVNTETGNQEMVDLLIRKGMSNGYARGDAIRDGVLERFKNIDNEIRTVRSLTEKYDVPYDVADYEILQYMNLAPQYMNLGQPQPGGKRKTKKSKAKKGSKKSVSRRNKNKK
jgi:hypothetical protein